MENVVDRDDDGASDILADKTDGVASYISGKAARGGRSDIDATGTRPGGLCDCEAAPVSQAKFDSLSCIESNDCSGLFAVISPK